MTKIKIAHILHSVGGVDISLRLILQNINVSKFENIVIHGKNDTKDIFMDSNSNIVNEFKLSISREISLIEDFNAILKTYLIVKKEKPDLIHAHSAKGGVIGRVVGLLTSTKVIYTPQAFSYLSASNKLKRALYLFIEKILTKGNTLLLASSPSEMNRGLIEVGYHSNKVKLFNTTMS